MWSEEEFSRPFGLQTCLRAFARIIYVVTDDPEGYAAGLTEWFKPKRYIYLWANDGEKRVEKQRHRWTADQKTLNTTDATFQEVLRIDPRDGNHVELVTNPTRWFDNPEWVGMFALHTDSDDRRLQILCFFGPDTEIPVSLQPLVLRVGPPLDNPRYGADLFSETCLDPLKEVYHKMGPGPLTWCQKVASEHIEAAQKPNAIATDLTAAFTKLAFKEVLTSKDQIKEAAKVLEGFSLFQVREILSMAITLNKQFWEPDRPKSFVQPWKTKAKEDLAAMLSETVEAITQHYGWPA